MSVSIFLRRSKPLQNWSQVWNPPRHPQCGEPAPQAVLQRFQVDSPSRHQRFLRFANGFPPSSRRSGFYTRPGKCGVCVGCKVGNSLPTRSMRQPETGFAYFVGEPPAPPEKYGDEFFNVILRHSRALTFMPHRFLCSGDHRRSASASRHHCYGIRDFVGSETRLRRIADAASAAFNSAEAEFVSAPAEMFCFDGK